LSQSPHVSSGGTCESGPAAIVEYCPNHPGSRSETGCSAEHACHLPSQITSAKPELPHSTDHERPAGWRASANATKALPRHSHWDTATQESRHGMQSQAQASTGAGLRHPVEHACEGCQGSRVGAWPLSDAYIAHRPQRLESLGTRLTPSSHAC